MLRAIRERLDVILNSERNYPVLSGIIAGVYPLLYFYSNNFYSNNSIEQFAFYTTVVVLLPTLAIFLAYKLFSRNKYLRKYKKHLLFVSVIAVTWTFMSLAIYMAVGKKLLLLVVILACLVSIKLYSYYRHLVILLLLASIVPAGKVILFSFYYAKGTEWATTDSKILSAKFVTTPNIYLIQPDGYVSKPTLNNPPYSSDTKFYEWLEKRGFTVYDKFHSNYPGSLSSNASMFAMKQHYFSDMLFPVPEIPLARETILNNNALRVLKNNGYHMSYISQYEYFQQNRSTGLYDYYNISPDKVPYFSDGGAERRDVYEELKKAMAYKTMQPKFYFVEKILPHHIYFTGPGGKEAGRKKYLRNVGRADTWLEETISMISSQDPEGIIIVLADHGGYVGMETFREFYTTKDNSLIESTFGNLAAIKWNSTKASGYDKGLVSNVNVFRVLFSALAEDSSHLKYMEDNGSYNLREDSYLYKSVFQLIDDYGNVAIKKREN